MHYLYVFLAFALIISCSNQTNKTDIETQVLLNSDAEKIRRTIHKNKHKIDSLYLDKLRIEPALQGILKFRLIINKNGKVIDSEVIKSGLNGLEKDVLSVLEAIQFPTFDSEIKINYTFEFFPN